MYIKFENGIVSEIIPDINPMFPDVPIEERYPADFIKELRYCDDESDIEIGMRYNEETDSFEYPPPPDLPPMSGIDAEDTGDAGDITQAEINLEVEYRLSCLELGI